MSLLEIAGPAVIRVGRKSKVRSPFDDITEQRFRDAAKLFHDLCKARPGESRYRIAFAVGAAIFKLDPKILQSHCEGSPSNEMALLTETRQQLMAFSRVVSLAGGPINTWKGIGRAFHRHHSTVIYATKIYGDEIARIIHGF